MAKQMSVDIITREIIKPSSPTPEHLRYIKLSLLDQITFAMTTPVILFYPIKGNDSPDHDIKLKSQRLKSSLSKALALFYPLAGRIRDNSLIECDDRGVDYVEAQVNGFISDLLQEPDNNVLNKLLTFNYVSPTEAQTCAIIQVNFFTCGGLAIGVSLSHKICDGISLATFFMAWAATSRSLVADAADQVDVVPHFVSDMIIPSLKDSSVLHSPLKTLQFEGYKTRRYVFDASKIASLKAKVASVKVERPTRVEAVTALIWKCLMSASRLNSGCPRQSALVHAVNLRNRFAPPLPQNYVGNLTGRFLAKKNEIWVDLQDLVTRLREGLEHVIREVQVNNVPGILEFGKELGDLISGDDIDLYSFTSLCGYPLYETDFGWGKPAWVIVANLMLKNFGVLIDSKDGKGVEAWLCLSEEDFGLLEQNQEFLAFASFIPSTVQDQHTIFPAVQSRM